MKRIWLVLLVALVNLTWSSEAFTQDWSPTGGNWLELNGDDAYYAIDNASLDIGDESWESITVESWVFIDIFPDACFIVDKDVYRLALSGVFAFLDKKHVGFGVSHEGGSRLIFAAVVEADVVQRWIHIAGVFDNQRNKMSIFIDGVLTYEDEKAITYNIRNSDSPLTVGGCNGEEGVTFSGRIDELRISDIARYKGNFIPRRTPFEPDANTRALYHFDEQNSPFADASGNGNTLWHIGVAPNKPPVVLDIPDKTIEEGVIFTIIHLDDYVSDLDNEDTEIVWTYSGNDQLNVSINDDRIATIEVRNPKWNGSETITFTATDPGGLSDSDSVTFTVGSVNDPPVVSDIPDQTIEEGGAFASIKLNDYVSDPDNADTEMTWTFTGNTNLAVSIDESCIATITVSEMGWSGSETITFMAEDPSGLSASDNVTFTVIPLAFLPGDINGDGAVRSNDAILALRISAGLMEPTDYQERAADMNGDGEVRSNDAILILRKSAGLAAPGAGIASPVHEPAIIALDNSYGVAGESITVPVTVSNYEILAGGDICIAYDNSVLRAVDVLSDSDTLLVTDISKQGVVRIAFASVDRLNSKTLAQVRFDVLEDAISPLKFRNVELYSPDALPLSLRSIDKEFRSWAIPPEHSALLQNYPNPFNPETWIPYQLRNGSDVTIRIYSATGEVVRELDLGYRAAGLYISHDRAAYWDGKNRFGMPVASGVYFYSIHAGDFSAVKKLIVLK